MNMDDLATQLLYTTVPIRGITYSGVEITGTGFLFSVPHDNSPNQTIPLLLTNYHVLENIKEGFITFNIGKDDMPVKNKTVNVSFDNTIITNSKLGNLDMVALPIATMINDLNEKGINIFYKTILPDLIPSNNQIKNLSAIEDLTFIGYPSGIIDEVNNSPIIRQGITASPIWNDFKGKPEFLIDGGVFPGSSGSPVFIYNQGSYATSEGVTIGTRIYFVGVIFSTQVSSGDTYLNLGRAIKSTNLFDELKNFIKKLQGNK